MINGTGSIVLNGVTDTDLVRILEVKIKHERVVSFNPPQMQPVNTQQGQTYRQVYNNVILGWTNEEGLKAVHQILSILLEKEERKEQAA